MSPLTERLDRAFAELDQELDRLKALIQSINCDTQYAIESRRLIESRRPQPTAH